MGLTWETNGNQSYTPVLTSTGFSTGRPQVWHPVYGPQRVRLRVRPGMVALYTAALTLAALLLCGPSQWRWMSLGLLPVVVTAIAAHRKPFDPLIAIRRKGLVPPR